MRALCLLAVVPLTLVFSALLARVAQRHTLHKS